MDKELYSIFLNKVSNDLMELIKDGVVDYLNKVTRIDTSLQKALLEVVKSQKINTDILSDRCNFLASRIIDLEKYYKVKINNRKKKKKQKKER